MASNKSRKMGKKLFVTLPFRNRLEYWNGDGQCRIALNVATSCANTMMISEVTPEKHLLFYTFVKKIANMSISGLLSQNLLDRSRPYIQF